MPKNTFIFKHFIINQDSHVMKVGTDAMILGAYVGKMESECAESGSAKSGNILDIGTGTGVLALMLAQRITAAIDAIDINQNACSLAKENFENSMWRNRLHVYHSLIQDFIPYDNKKYSLIISNPPYFEHNLKASGESERYKQRSQARSFHKLNFPELILHASRLLRDDGRFYVIIPFKEAGTFISLAAESQLLLSDRLNIHSKEKLHPVRCVLGFTKSKEAPKENRLVIYEEDGSYTDDYIKLTRDYYARPLRPKGRHTTVK